MTQGKPETVKKVKIQVSDLRPGMHICELDRPWLGTPFLDQGFEVTNFTDIKTVMDHCEYVYIDPRRSKSVDFQSGRREVAAARPALRFPEKAMETVDVTRKQTSDLIKSYLDDICFGNSPDIQLAHSAASVCVSHVVRNPEAVMFLARLRGKFDDASRQAFNVCVYSIIIGRLLGLDSLKLENLGTSALLHDMGFVGVPDAVLNKPGFLSAEEMAVVQTHPRRGRDILISGRHIFSGAVDVAYGHHENLDGTGYPRGLAGHQISLFTKIVAVVDKYDSIMSPMPYRPAGDHLDAVSILKRLAKTNKIDPAITSLFVSYLGVYPPGCVVELSTGEVAIVTRSNPQHALLPQVLVVRDRDRQPVQHLVDLADKASDGRGRPCRIVSVRRPGEFGINADQCFEQIMRP